jgi:hypothetical protein
MAQQPYMGLGLLLLPLSEVTKSCAFVGDWSTGSAYCSIDPDVPARAIWQAHQETWARNGGNLAYATFLFMPVRFFYMPYRLLYFPSEGSGAPDFFIVFLSNPRTLGPVASTLTTSPPRSTHPGSW